MRAGRSGRQRRERERERERERVKVAVDPLTARMTGQHWQHYGAPVSAAVLCSGPPQRGSESTGVVLCASVSFPIPVLSIV